MDIGTEAKCSRCGQVFYLYSETHKYNYDYRTGKSTIGGMCPLCCNRVTMLMQDKEVILYNASDRRDPKLTVYPYYGGD